MLTRRGIVATALASVLMVQGFACSTTAQADSPVCIKRDDRTGVCVLTAGTAGSPGAPGGASSGNQGSDSGSGPSIVNITIGNTVCTVGPPASPQPPASDPVWAGHTDGAIYTCFATNGRFGAPATLLFWSATPPAVAPPDPRVLAQQAVAAMGLRAVAIGIAPEARAGSVGIIGMPTWMWVADPGEQTWGPMTRSASAGGYTVTATAKVDRVVWVMGDGSTVTCTTKGTPYADSFGKKSSPDCGHTYTRQGNYVVAATSYWTVTWAGIGQTGTIPLDFTQQATIVMGESQVLSN